MRQKIMTTTNNFAHPLAACRLALQVVLALPIAISAVTAAQAQTADLETVRKFDIKAQNLQTALIEFSKQADLQVIGSTKALAGAKTSGVSGALRNRDALKSLLNGTSLVFAPVGRHSVKIVPAGETRGIGGARLDGLLLEQTEMLLAENSQQSGQPPGRQKTGKSAGDVEEMIVEENRIKPFSDANVDIPRTKDDVQPYYIFDSKTIERSGAANIEDFLKQRLTMNSAAQTNGQVATFNNDTGVRGNISAIDLRGLGADKTLVLINGRRAAGVTIGANVHQADLNGIPMSAIERIEVLPSSASGIYGGSAIGGVINVVLKRNYSGGEVRAQYDNTWGADAPTRTISASYGTGLQGGKTNLTMTASWSDVEPLLLADRRELIDRSIRIISNKDPSFLSAPMFLGALPNIATTGYFDAAANVFRPAPSVLTLKNGAVLPSRYTHIRAGTAPGTSMADLSAALAANAGVINLELPPSTQAPSGLYRQFGVASARKSFGAAVRRQMLPNVELFAEFMHNENPSRTVYNDTTSFSVLPDAPTNPFAGAVTIMFPNASDLPMTTKSQSQNFTLGTLLRLPGGWTGELDYTRSESQFEYLYFNLDTTGVRADLANGTLNPFVDTIRFPVSLNKYLVQNPWTSKALLDDYSMRGSGALFALPWGRPNLTLGLERRVSTTPENTGVTYYPINVQSTTRYTQYVREQSTDSIYGELSIPLVKAGSMPLLHGLDIQLSGRSDRYVVDSGTPRQRTNLYTGVVTYDFPTINGQPFTSKSSYVSTNKTMGLKYDPVPGVSLRTSLATAFLPPTPDQLLQYPPILTNSTSITDPRNPGPPYSITTMYSGNPDLKPQNSKSWNAGIIWQPQWAPLKDLRFNAEYYRIEQFDAIGSLSAQQFVDYEAAYPGRVTRDASGRVTFVDTKLVNLYRRKTSGWDISAEYRWNSPLGVFRLQAAESIIMELRNQFSLTLPDRNFVNFPSEGGAAKYKSNAMLSWERRQWLASWTARYFGSYKLYGAAGGPSAQQYGVDTYYANIQGSDTIPSQTYHDLFVSYNFGDRNKSGSKIAMVGGALLDGLDLQVGVRNIFNTLPPFDVAYRFNYYASPYGDMRLRSYWLNVTKRFGK